MKFLQMIKQVGDLFKETRVTSKTVLLDAIGNVQLLILTAAENAIELPEEALSSIMLAKQAFEENRLEPEMEVKFWASYQIIAREMSPISINSVKATFDPHPSQRFFLWNLLFRRKMPLSRQCAFNYKLLSLITLFLLIALQIYWYIGWSLTSDITTQSQIVTSVEIKLETLVHEHEVFSLQNNRPLTEKELNKENILRRKMKEHRSWRDAASNHLENWNSVWSDMDLLTLQPWQMENYEDFSDEVKRRIQFVSAGNTLQAITAYLLPILYGLIGACFYILRQLPKEIENLTFSMNSYIDYSLRMVQGPLAGIMVSYFLFNDIEPDKSISSSAAQIHSIDANLTTLSPLALAFLAGYSVEFIFKFIDKILSTTNLGSSELPDSSPTPENQSNTRTNRKIRNSQK
jgi:hypothetical protein